MEPYGAQRSQRVATGGKSPTRENGADRRKPSPWVATGLPRKSHGKEEVDNRRAELFSLVVLSPGITSVASVANRLSTRALHRPCRVVPPLLKPPQLRMKRLWRWHFGVVRTAVKLSHSSIEAWGCPTCETPFRQSPPACLPERMGRSSLVAERVGGTDSCG
jgi:hypothetical protein